MVWPHCKIVLHVEDNSAKNGEDERREECGRDIHPRQWKTEKVGEEVLKHHQWYPNDHQD